jgi:hypothetical protein
MYQQFQEYPARFGGGGGGGGRRERPRGVYDRQMYDRQEIYREGSDSSTASSRDSVEHLYISPRYAEHMEHDYHSTGRKSVQFYFGPAENEAGGGGPPVVERSAVPHRGGRVERRQEEVDSDDTQGSDGETIVADDEEGRRYVGFEPYGDIPFYGQVPDPTPPPLPEATGGMLSHFLEVINHVPFIREDLAERDATPLGIGQDDAGPSYSARQSEGPGPVCSQREASPRRQSYRSGYEQAPQGVDVSEVQASREYSDDDQQLRVLAGGEEPLVWLLKHAAGNIHKISESHKLFLEHAYWILHKISK